MSSEAINDSLLLSRIGCRIEFPPDFSVAASDPDEADVGNVIRGTKWDVTDLPSSNGSSIEDPSSGERSDGILAIEAEDVIRPLPTTRTIFLSWPRPGLVTMGQPQRASICRQRCVRSARSCVTSSNDILASRMDLSTWKQFWMKWLGVNFTNPLAQNTLS